LPTLAVFAEIGIAVKTDDSANARHIIIAVNFFIFFTPCYFIYFILL